MTNNGSAVTDASQWTDTVWLTTDKTRPSPGPRSVLSQDGSPIVIQGNNAIFLGSFGHSGVLAVGDSYTQVVQVHIPNQISSGTYYLTAWADAYDNVFEDQLAINVNPDDPNTLDSSNFKAAPIDIIGTPTPPLPDLQVTAVTTNASAASPASVNQPLVVTWTVQNLGEGAADHGIDGNADWFDSVYLHTTPNINDPGADVWYLGSFQHSGALASLASYTQTETIALSPATRGLYVTVFADQTQCCQNIIESNENNNGRTVTTDVVDDPSNLVVTSVNAPDVNYSGEKTTITWTVENEGGAVWSGTRLWADYVYISPDPTFGNRAQILGSTVHSNADGLATGASYTASANVVIPAGFSGPYFLYVFTNGAPPYPSILSGGDNSRAIGDYGGTAYEGVAYTDNELRGTIDVTYREPDLTISSVSISPGPIFSGQDVTVTFTVDNIGTRDTRQSQWDDRVYLSLDPSLDQNDLQVASITHWWWFGQLAMGASYTRTVTFQIPADASGRFYLIVFTDANVTGELPNGAQTIGVSHVGLSSDAVPEFKDEGNNTTVVPIDVTLSPAADLQVTSVDVPEHVLRGQTLDVSFTVTNEGGSDTPSGDVRWNDLVYLSADPLLDPNADRYLGQVEHKGVVAANGGSYTVSASFKLPAQLTGTYYVIVLTDPTVNGAGPRGKVFEGAFENNNATASADPVIIDQPPPSDLVVSGIVVPASGQTGQPVTISFSVTNQSGATAQGSWSDAVYLSTDSQWDLSDILLGKVVHTGDVAVGGSYTGQLTATLPPAKEGSYRIIVRTDIFNEVYEGVDERNNTTASETALSLTVPQLQLGVPVSTTLSLGTERLYKVTVDANETLSIALNAADDLSANELYVRFGDVASGFAYDYGAQQVLSANPSTLVPSTQAGDYYILVLGRSSNGQTAATLTVTALPFSVTDITVDQGGDSKWVTATITGARFDPGALVKLVRPGIDEITPANFQVIDATKIIATFDLTGAAHGLYDVAVINPDGEIASLPYRYLIEDALPIDVTIGLGGPRVVPDGSTGLFSVSLQSLTNVDTPYVYFTFGAPELGDNQWVFNLPYLTFSSNVTGQPDNNQRTDVRGCAEQRVNTNALPARPRHVKPCRRSQHRVEGCRRAIHQECRTVRVMMRRPPDLVGCFDHVSSTSRAVSPATSPTRTCRSATCRSAGRSRRRSSSTSSRRRRR